MLISVDWLRPFYDLPAGWILFYMGGNGLLFILFVLIIWIEGLVLEKRGYASRWWSLGASLGMNLVSSLLGYLAAIVIEWQPMASAYDDLSGTLDPVGVVDVYGADLDAIVQWFFTTPSAKFSPVPALLLFFVVSWLVSVVSETLVLLPKRSKSPQAIWKMVIEANIYTYVLMIFALLLVYWLPGLLSLSAPVAFFVLSAWPIFIVIAGLFLLKRYRARLIALPWWGILIMGAFSGWLWAMISRIMAYNFRFSFRGLAAILFLPETIARALLAPRIGRPYWITTLVSNGSLIIGVVLGILFALVYLGFRHNKRSRNNQERSDEVGD